MNKIKTEFRVLSFAFTDSLKTIFTDPGALLILLFAAVFYPVVYSIAYSNEVIEDMSVVVVDCDNTQMSRQWSRMVDATPAVQVKHQVKNMVQAQELFWQGEANAVLYIPTGFERHIFKGNQATVSMYADGSNFLYYKETLRAAMQGSGTLSAGVEIKRFLSKGLTENQALNRTQALNIASYSLYNPSGAYGSFVMPGIIIIIIQQTLLIGIGLVGGAGRERKRDVSVHLGVALGNHASAAILGKSLAYFAIGLFNFLFGSIWVYHWFAFPDKSLFINQLTLVIPFLFSVIFMGMALSLFFKHREYSIMFLVFLSPLVLFVSGLSWPVEAMPKLLHSVFCVFPTTFMVPAFIRIKTMGVQPSDVSYEFTAMLIQSILFFIIAVASFKRVVIKHD